MNLDYKQKYLKYKNKYLLAKSQQGGVLTLDQQTIVNQIKKGFVSKTKLDTHNILNYMSLIGTNATSLTQQKIELLFKWSVMDEKEAPVGFQFKTDIDYDKQIKLITIKINQEEDEKESDFLVEQKQELNKSKEAEIERMKIILYNKLLSTIFDDAVTIEQFTELANQLIE